MAIRNRAGRAPGSYPIALCLAGLSPAVVTETLYALAVLKRPRVVPRRVCILTSADAYGPVVSTLPGNKGAIRRLARDYGLPDRTMVCSLDDVVVLRSRSGKPLPDIRTSLESREVGEAISALLARLHEDPKAVLHCSLAGGRKTMGALLALALQLCARPGDRLYHVLVDEPFDRIPGFYYPPPRCCFCDFEGKKFDLREARVDLAEIPLVRLGAVVQSLGLVTEDLARRAERLEHALAHCFRPPHLKLDPRRCVVSSGRTKVSLPPLQFALYMLYAGLRAGCARCSTNGSAGCEKCQPSDKELYYSHRAGLLSAYRRCRPGGSETLARLLTDDGRTERARTDFDDWLRQTRSKLSRRLRTWALADPALAAALIQPFKAPSSSGENRRGLRLAPRLVRFANVAGGSLQR